MPRFWKVDPLFLIMQRIPWNCLMDWRKQIKTCNAIYEIKFGVGLKMDIASYNGEHILPAR